MQMTNLELDLDFTHGCNMNCNHCFADAHSPMANDLTLEEYQNLLEQSKGHKLFRVSWGLGGEALSAKHRSPRSFNPPSSTKCATSSNKKIKKAKPREAAPVAFAASL